MAKGQKTRPISLTNKTAVNLRRTAQNVRRAWLIAMGVTAMLATVAAVYMGLTWLPAVPLTLLAGGVVIAAMMLISRSQYLLLVSQAICTEAASRQMREQAGENDRRRRALEELAAIRADVRAAQGQSAAQDEREQEALLFELLTGRTTEEDMKNKSEEDEDLYDADRREDEDAPDEDLYAPKADSLPQKRIAPAVKPQPMSLPREAPVGRTQPVVRVASPTQEKNDASAPRRRRRQQEENAPASSLQLIRGEQAK